MALRVNTGALFYKRIFCHFLEKSGARDKRMKKRSGSSPRPLNMQLTASHDELDFITFTPFFWKWKFACYSSADLKKSRNLMNKKKVFLEKTFSRKNALSNGRCKSSGLSETAIERSWIQKNTVSSTTLNRFRLANPLQLLNSFIILTN